MRSLSAARPKCSSSATARKAVTCLNSIASPQRCRLIRKYHQSVRYYLLDSAEFRWQGCRRPRPRLEPEMTTTTTTADPSDLLDLAVLRSVTALDLGYRVRAVVDDRIRPNIADWYENAVFPTEIVKDMGDLGLLGMHLHGYGCPGRTAVEYGLAALELEAGD